ncbi:RidA family protein [Vibrio variabilis]|uniref:RidA family protein n=1 Tax=Vibrio variabilis TaxID=990271 RepID=UPI000DDAA6AD|nr:RidA family protein [Vibrio variabilis]
MSERIIKSSVNTDQAPVNSFSTQSVAFSHYNNISAQLPIHPQTNELVPGGVEAQARQCLENIKQIVESIDHTMGDVVKINLYLTNIADIDRVHQVYKTFFPLQLPTSSTLAVLTLPVEGALVQMDALISNGEGTYPQQACDLIKVSRNTRRAPMSAVASQSVAFSHYNHISAQLPIDSSSGNVVDGGIREQARQCLQNLKAVLESVSVPFDDIVKINAHVRDLDDIEAFDEVYSTFFPDSSIARAVNYLPARSVMVVEGLPMHARVQVDATVSHGDGTPPQRVEDRHGIVIRSSNTDKAPKHNMSTQTVAFSHYNNISAQLPIDPEVGEIISVGLREQTAQCLTNIQTIIESIDHVMDDVVKLNIQLTDLSELVTLQAMLPSYFKGDMPALTIVGVSRLPKGAIVQIDAIVSNAEGTPPVGGA